MSFNEKYNAIKLLTNEQLLSIQEKMLSEISVEKPLNSSLEEFLMSPSKRVRSVISILAAKAFGTELSDNQLEFLSAIELIHNASLIHDDVIDEDKIRRGYKTLSDKFDNKLAVISGDYILSLAMNKLIKIGHMEIIKKVTDTIKSMCAGEIKQNFSRYKTGTIEQYLEKTKDKTAYLFETALVGVFMLQNNSVDIERISRLGLNIGIAFQIRDDILNLKSADNIKSATDIVQGVYNAPIILGKEEDNYQSGIEKTKILLDNYVEKAKNELAFLAENNYKTALYEFLELLKNV